MALHDDLVIRVCERIAGGMPIRKAAKAEDTSAGMFMHWIAKADQAGNHELVERYTRAMKCRADVKFEELEDVSDEAATATDAVKVNGLRLKSDNIKWMIAKMNAKKYGEKLELGGEIGMRNLSDEQVKAQTLALLAKIGIDAAAALPSAQEAPGLTD